MRRRLWLLSLQMAVLVAAVCAVLLLLSAPAWARSSRDDAAVAAQRLNNGRVLSIEKLEPGHRAVWRVKILTAQGEIRIVLIDRHDTSIPTGLNDFESVQVPFIHGGAR